MKEMNLNFIDNLIAQWIASNVSLLHPTENTSIWGKKQEEEEEVENKYK